jgi:predicted dehydrogenase
MNEVSSDKSAKSDQSEIITVSRRELAAGGLASLIVPRHVLGGPGYQAPSDTLAIAAIGVGGMGRNYLEGCSSERIVALCDLDHQFAGPVFAKYPQATRYRDWRQMLDKEAKNFDALIIATPDHTHAVIQMAALKMRKHIYCAKPLTHNINEARRISAAATEAKVITQTSVQSCASEAACGTTEILMSGVLGGIREVHAWEPQPIYPCSLLRPTDTPAPPEGMDWDLWVGPAPMRPYHSAYHPVRWRAWWDFGSGDVGDMACHTLHTFYNALRLGERPPKLVHAYRSYLRSRSGLVVTPESTSHATEVTWEFPATGDMPAMNLYWYDGGMRPLKPVELDKRIPMPARGTLFVGEKGKLLSGFGGGGDMLLPVQKFHDFQRPLKTLSRTIGHYREWTQGCKTGKRTNCPIEFGAKMTELALLGAIAVRKIPRNVGNGWDVGVLEWDAEAMRITNDAEANGWVNPPYRVGWSI